jgi:putative transposase
MSFNPDRHRRRSIRLPKYAYTQAGEYFITICSFDRSPIFGEIRDQCLELNRLGDIVSQVWSGLSQSFPGLELDEFVVMPNHFHGILRLQRQLPQEHELPLEGSPKGTQSGSVGAIVQNFKSVSTRRINQARGIPGGRVWQRNYYECIIPDYLARSRIRAYVLNNPRSWKKDKFHTS